MDIILSKREIPEDLLEYFEAVPEQQPSDLWFLSPEPVREAHFAVFPSAIPRKAIGAGTSEAGCCVNCEAPFERVIERGLTAHDGSTATIYPEGTTGNRISLLRQAARERGEEYTNDVKTVGWRPTCACGSPGLSPEDVEIINSPLSRDVQPAVDLTLQTGRRGIGRERREDEGQRPITRFEQRQYAEQLKASPHREEMENEVGESAFAHYRRTDRKGARPIPQEVLERWIAQGWISRVDPPVIEEVQAKPCRVLDPFNGSGTTGVAALQMGREYDGIELNPEYIGIAQKRLESSTAPPKAKKVRSVKSTPSMLQTTLF